MLPSACALLIAASASPPEVLIGTRPPPVQPTCTTSLLLEVNSPSPEGSCDEWRSRAESPPNLELVVFGLDKTLWYPQLDTLEGGPPFELVDGGMGGVKTSAGERLDLFPAARRALMELAGRLKREIWEKWGATYGRNGWVGERCGEKRRRRAAARAPP